MERLYLFFEKINEIYNPLKFWGFGIVFHFYLFPGKLGFYENFLPGFIELYNSLTKSDSAWSDDRLPKVGNFTECSIGSWNNETYNETYLEDAFTSFGDGLHRGLFGFRAGTETGSDLNFYAPANSGAVDGCHSHSQIQPSQHSLHSYR